MIPINVKVAKQRKVRSTYIIMNVMKNLLFLVCSHSCDKVRSVCTNNTDCNMIWNKYNTYCDGVMAWDGNSTMPMCTDTCKKWIEELENNRIGKYTKCCRCDKENEVEKIQCIRERQNVAIVCDVDYNHVKDCHDKEELCVNDTITFLKHYEVKKDSDRQGRQQ